MPHNRSPKKSNQWYLPKAQYKYVVSFCLTYDELRKRLVELNGWHSRVMDGMPHSNTKSNPTEAEAMERLKVSQKIMLIEQAVLEVAGKELYRPMLFAITKEDVPLWRLKQDYGVKMGKNQFSDLRRKIYFTISKYL